LVTKEAIFLVESEAESLATRRLIKSVELTKLSALHANLPTYYAACMHFFLFIASKTLDGRLGYAVFYV
jgi:hypothetical protein